jgi:hypothetical protein
MCRSLYKTSIVGRDTRMGRDWPVMSPYRKSCSQYLTCLVKRDGTRMVGRLVRQRLGRQKTIKNIEKMAGEPVSRILCRTQTAKQFACAAIIPLGHDSHRDSSSLPEGSRLRWLAPPQKELSLIEPGRLSPPIWPCTTRGFPCLRCHHRSGGLLPHLFTLAKRCEL